MGGQHNAGTASCPATEANKPRSKARPQHLESEVVPDLIKKVGDPKSMRLALWMVEAYLDRHVLIFDKALLADMFAEADYKEEGSLCTRALAAAISGRYPQRKLTQAWRKLVMLLLGQQELVLSAEVVQPQRATNGVFNADGGSWPTTPPELPPVPQHNTTSSPARPEFQRPLTDTWGGQTVRSLSMTGPGSAPLAASLKASNQLNAFMAPRLDEKASSDALMLTTAGFRTTATTATEDELNQSMVGDSTSRCTFDDAAGFDKFTRGLSAAASMGLGSAGAAQLAASAATHGNATWTLPARGTAGAGTLRLAGETGTARSGLSSAAAQTRSAGTAGNGALAAPSALSTLRSTVTSTLRCRPVFELMHKPLTVSDMTRQYGLSQALESAPSVARQQPTRPTEMKFGASFLEWGSYNTTCRSLPSVWDHGHPAAPASARAKTQFPWGGDT